MNIFTKTYNQIKASLSVLRKPAYTSAYSDLLNQYSWIAARRNKYAGVGWETYYRAGNNVWLRACINVYLNEVRNLGFTIKSPEETHQNIEKVHYLEGLFNNPMGFSNNDTYSIFQSQMWESLLLLGDAFCEVIYDDKYKNIPIGFKHIPTELMFYYEETDEWGFINNNHRFDPKDLVHIKEPSPRGSVWGRSPVDTLARDITLEILGRDFTKEILERKGLDPSGTIEFDSNLDNVSYNQEIARLQAMANGNRHGTMVLRGAKFNKVGITNEDLQYAELMEDIRDRILAVMGVPPSHVSILQTASLDTGSGQSQDKRFKKVFQGKAKLFEDGYNKVLGRSGFRETFHYKEADLQDSLVKAQTEEIKIRSGILSVNEVRQTYGLPPVPETTYNSNIATKKYKQALISEGLLKNNV